MARVCACGEYFNVNDEGELCLNPGTMGLRQIVRFLGAGTYQFDKSNYPWVARVRIMVQGAGGGSAGAIADAGESVWRAGGAGGGYSESLLDISLLGAVETVVVGEGGEGGIGNNPGTAGGSSSFGGLVIANGGAGSAAAMPSGTTPTTATGNAGPPGLTGQLAAGGGAGAGSVRLAAAVGIAGAGGESRLGHGGVGRSNQGAGTPTRGYGGGAGGAASYDRNAYNGGDGGVGVVMVELYG
ncbi:hypothetical protein [Streptomyces sp. NPDC058548]|uniref:glycine-rich domain-containing protein n=1 Tax=Streptomyces sp. NPDC058548 TaxID=3346545 RepID=UPI00364AD20C